MGRFPDSRDLTYYIFEQNGIYTMEQIEGLTYWEQERQYDGAFMWFNVKYSRRRDINTKIKNDLKGWLPKYDIPYETEITIKDKKDTTGELWIRLNNHPIAFPALAGNYPQIAT